jgi:colicin import membrane protein
VTATVANGSADALRPTPPPGMGRGALLSALAHALLIVALAVGLSWRSHAPQTFSAELWSAVPQAAAPRGAPPPPAPAPAPPVPRAAPPAPAPAPPKADAQIAIEKAREAQREREQQAERARLEREKAEKAKAEREKAERAKAEQARADRERAEREKAEAREREKQAQAREEEARLARQREENLKRMMGQAGVAGVAGVAGAPTSTGSALRDSAPSASYAGKLIARVKPNIVLTSPVPGQPAAEVEVRAAPSGTILSRRLVKSSGNKDWDDAVLRAIDRTAELPRDDDGRVPPVVLITFTP